MLKPNDAAPDFELQADDGSTVRLSDLRGRKVVLYFYPKDDTPGCTTEACEFRDRSKDLAANGAVVLGVSPDTVESHKRFKEKYG
ncbi:MAG TPA: peroxiredoxin, partial [Longimicrobiales bacterium]